MDDGCVEIRIEDDISGCRAIQAEVQIKDFAEALMGHGYMDCEFKLNTSGVIGKARELKTITVKRPQRSGRGQDHDAGLKWIQKHAADELVDGWEPHNPSEAFNHHRWCGNDTVRVTLIRFVEAKEEA